MAPRSFRTRAGGLFLFLPVMQDIRLGEVVRQVGLPGSALIPAEQAVRSLLALKLLGTERKSHVMDLVCDQGIALFAGLNAVPSSPRVLLRYDSERHSHGCMISDAGTPGFSGFSSDHMDAIPVILTTM